MQVLTAFIPVFLFSNANFSETIQVTAIFKPEVATVMKNKYTAITKLKIPTASEPILLEIYILKTNVTNLIINAVIVRIVPFIKNNLLFFLKTIHLIKNIFLASNLCNKIKN